MDGIHYENVLVENGLETFAFENLKSLERKNRWKNTSYHLAFPLSAHTIALRNSSLRLSPVRIAGLSPGRTDYLMPWKTASRLAKTIFLTLIVSSCFNSWAKDLLERIAGECNV